MLQAYSTVLWSALGGVVRGRGEEGGMERRGVIFDKK